MQFDIHTHTFDKSLCRIFNSGLSGVDEGFFSSGLHPWEANKWNDQRRKQLSKLITRSNCVAVGETGLDKLKGPSLKIQIQCLEEQLILAESEKLPVILHIVRSWNEVKPIIKNSQTPLIWHGFNKSKLLNEVLSEGVYISLGRSLILDQDLQHVIREAPIDKIFLETDDSPIQIEAVYRKLAELKELTLAELEHQISKNIHNVFPKWTIGLNGQNY